MHSIGEVEDFVKLVRRYWWTFGCECVHCGCRWLLIKRWRTKPFNGYLEFCSICWYKDGMEGYSGAETVKGKGNDMVFLLLENLIRYYKHKESHLEVV